MLWQSLEWTLPVAADVLAIVLLLGFTIHVVLRRPQAPLGAVIPLVFSAGLIFAIGDLITVLSGADPDVHWLGMIALYTGLLIFAPAWFHFTLRYAQLYTPDAFNRWRLSSTIPIGLNLVLWGAMVTNPWHEFFLVQEVGGQSHYQPLWYVLALSNYSLIVISIALQLRISRNAPDPIIRSQSRVLAAGAAVPFLASVSFVSMPGLFPFDPTAMGFCVTCGLFLFAIGRRRFFVIQGVSLTELLGRDSDAVLVVSTANRLLYANPRAVALFPNEMLVPGISIEELVAKHLPGLDLPADPAALPEDPALGEGLRFEDAAGEIRWLAIERTPLAGRRGHRLGYCLRLRDRTELRAAIRATEAHAALLEGVDLAGGQALLVTDRGADIRYVNEAFKKLWGLPDDLDAARDRHLIRDSLKKQLPELPSELFERALHADRERRLTGDVRTIDGRVIEFSTFPVDHATGFAGRVCRMVDVTQARKDATSMLHTQKLEGLGVLAGGIAHDFNNLLVSMLGNAEIAREELDRDSPIQKYLVDVEAAAERARELVTQLLAYTGKGKVVLESLDLSDLVRSVTELLGASIPKKVNLRYRLEDSLPLVRGGAGQLRQIVMNFVTNAADAMGGGEGVVRLETGCGTPPPLEAGRASMNYGKRAGLDVYLRVTDNGTGMDQNTLMRIFDPFFTTKFAGRGLGLAAALGIIQAHEGALQVESTPGRGTSFTLFLPAEAAVAVAPATKHEAVSRKHAGACVLVVDDEPEVREVTTRMLESSGYRVRQAVDGVEALHVYENDGATIDLVILDMTMPRLGGEETWKQLRQIDPEVRVLFCSGYSEESADDLLLEDGARVGFLHKPFRKAKLLEDIEALLGEGPALGA